MVRLGHDHWLPMPLSPVTVGSVFVFLHSPRSPLFYMADSSPTSNVIFEVVRTSLRLASNSSEVLTITHLHALKDELHATLAVVHAQIQSEASGMFIGNVLTSLATHPVSQTTIG